MRLICGLSVQVHQGNGPHLLLVHGMLASRSQWLPNLERFSHYTTPVTIELLGHHDSSAPKDALNYDPDTYVRSLDAIREELGVDSIFIGGCSLGAALTMRYALTHPQHVQGHFFTNSSSAFADDSMTRAWQENSEAGFHNILEGGRSAIDRIPVHPRFARRLPEEVKRALVDDSKSHSVYGIAATMRWTSPAASIRSKLACFRVPSMLLCGRFEKRFKPLFEVAKRKMPNLIVHELDAGHGVNMEAADAFNQHVETFVRRYS